MLEFGMPTFLEDAAPEDSVRRCAALGLQFVELNMSLPQYQPGLLDAAELAHLRQTYGVSYTLHLDENLNPFDFNPYVAEAYRKTALDAITLAKRLEIPVLNLHLPAGVYFTLPQGKAYLFERYGEAFRAGLERFREDCTRAVADAPITLCIENSSGYAPWQQAAVEALLQSPVFGLTLDVGHDHCTGGGDKAFILVHAERLHHLHLHDALRGARKQDHLPLGVGELDLPGCLALADRHNCRVVVETKTAAALADSVAWLCARGYLGQ